MRRQFIIFWGLIILIISGCGEVKPSYYYYEIAARTNALLKFQRSELDIFDYSLSAVIETVIDVSNADTARRYMLTQIAYPGGENQPLFQTPVEFKDYAYFINALKNMLSTGQKTDFPLYYQAALEMKVKYVSGQGFTFTDSAAAVFTVAEEKIPLFLDFAQDLSGNQPSAELGQKQAYVDSQRKAQIVRFKQKYRYRELSLGKTTLKLAVKSAASDIWNVECVFYVFNPNVYDCVFDAAFNLIGKKGGVIHTFKTEDFTIPANSGKPFSGLTVLKKFQAERLDFAQTQIYNVRTQDKVAKEYMK